MSDAAYKPIPSEILGRRVIGICPECEGEGRLWECDDQFTTHSATRCKVCNCVGFILDMPLEPPAESDQDDIPF